jgi:hypothetical protein
MDAIHRKAAAERLGGKESLHKNRKFSGAENFNVVDRDRKRLGNVGFERDAPAPRKGIQRGGGRFQQTQKVHHGCRGLYRATLIFSEGPGPAAQQLSGGAGAKFSIL